MIYFRGARQVADFVAADVIDNCPDLHVGTIPATLTDGGWINSPEWLVLVADAKEIPMLHVFSFTDEKHRTFQWGLDDDRGETVITCRVTQDYSIPIQTDDGVKVRAMQVQGFGRGPTAQIAYDQALADLVVNLKDADAKLRTMDDVPTVDVTLDEGPHRLFGNPKED